MRRNQVFNDSTKYLCDRNKKWIVNRPKQTKVIERKLNFFFSNNDLDLDHRHLGSDPKLRIDVSYLYTKFGVNRPKQT